MKKFDLIQKIAEFITAKCTGTGYRRLKKKLSLVIININEILKNVIKKKKICFYNNQNYIYLGFNKKKLINMDKTKSQVRIIINL